MYIDAYMLIEKKSIRAGREEKRDNGKWIRSKYTIHMYENVQKLVKN